MAFASMTLISAACSSSGDGPPASTASAERLPPTSSPGVTGMVDEGVAEVEIRGEMTAAASFDRLGTPAIWKPEPSGMALNWLASGGRSFGLTGSSFEGTAQTSSQLRLELAIVSGVELLAFRSDDGSCSVTIDRAVVSNVSGSFTCTALESTDGSVEVEATGTFTATDAAG